MAKVIRSDHAFQVRAASGINAALGLYLIASPWIWGYGAHGSAVWNSVAAGAVIALFAAARVRDPHHVSTLSWVNLMLGAWTIVSPWVFGYSPNGAAMWNNIILGAAVIVLAIVSGTATATEHPAAPLHA